MTSHAPATESGSRGRAILIASVLLGLTLGGVALVRLRGNSDDPSASSAGSEGTPPAGEVVLPAGVDAFGEPAAILPYLDEQQRAYAESFPPRVRDVLVRRWATDGRFQGRCEEFAVFLGLTHSISVPVELPAETDSAYWAEDRTVLTHSLGAMWRGWMRAGPVAECADRIAEEAIRLSRHPDTMVRWQASILLGALERLPPSEGWAMRGRVAAELDRVRSSEDPASVNLGAMLEVQLDHEASKRRATGG